MNMKSKVFCSLFIFSVLFYSLHAQKGYVVKKDGTTMKSVSIVADSKGVLTVATGPGGRIKTKIQPRNYQYARISSPADLVKAYKALEAKKYSDAASAFSKLYNKYKFVGWDVFCAYRGAQAYNELGETRNAIGLLEKLGDFPIDSKKTKYYLSGKKLLAELYAKSDKYSKAMAALQVLSQSNSDSFAAFSNNLQGDMLLKQGKKKDAKLMYLRTALLFGKSNTVERPEALFKTIKMLRAEKNNKALEFEKMLKNDYPGSKYINDL